MKEECYAENDEKRGKNRSQAGAESTGQLPYLIPHENADVGSENSRATLRNGDKVDELVLGNPSFFLHDLLLDDGQHGIAASKGKSSDLEKGLEGIPVEG